MQTHSLFYLHPDILKIVSEGAEALNEQQLSIIYLHNQYLTILDQEPHYIPTASSSDNTPTATEISLCSYRVLDRL